MPHVISDADWEFLQAAKAAAAKDKAYRRARAQRPEVKLREAERRAARREVEKLNSKLFQMIQRGMVELKDEPATAEGGEEA